MRHSSFAALRHRDGHKSWGQMLLMTGSCELCFTKWLISNLWPRRRAFAHGGNYERRGKRSRCGAGSTGLEGHVCEFTASSPVAWVVGAAPRPSPHREQGGPGGLQLWMQGRERQWGILSVEALQEAQCQSIGSVPAPLNLSRYINKT